MRKLILASFYAGLLAFATSPLPAQPMGHDEQRQWLLEQIRLGEAMQRETLVDDAVARLRLLNPQDPEALAAAIRQAVRHRDFDRARQQHEMLQRLAPDSQLTRQMTRLLAMTTGDGERTLQQIRLMAVAGRFAEAMALFESTFDSEEPPTLEFALEYWRVRSQLDGQLPATIERLQALEQLYPSSTALRAFLAENLFRARRDREALAVLHRMAAEPHSRHQAADMEFAYLSKQPVSDASVAAWEAFMTRYPSSDHMASAREILAAQRKVTSDAGWRAGQEAIRLLDRQGDSAQAERLLRRALQDKPDDATLKGYLGLALSRQGRREEAIPLLQAAAAEEQNTHILSKWRALLESTQYWYLLQRAREALEDQHIDEAERLYRQAYREQPQDANAILGLANVELARGKEADAEAFYRLALRLAPDNESAARGLMRLYQARSPEAAEAFYESLTPRQRQHLEASWQNLTVERLTFQADLARERGDWSEASVLLGEALTLTPDNPWLTLNLARVLLSLGRPDTADQHFADLLARKGDDPAARYAHGLYLESSDRAGEGLVTLAMIPRNEWPDGMVTLYERLQYRQLVAEAQALYQSGAQEAAMALLEQRINSDDTRTPTPYLTQLASWALERGEQQRADDYYQRILRWDPDNVAARLGRIEVLIAKGHVAAARDALHNHPPLPTIEQYELRRRLANAWAAVGDADTAISQLQSLVQDQPAPRSLPYRDLARLLAPDDANSALDYYALALRDAGLLAADRVQPRDDAALSAATLPAAADDWLARSLRSDIDTLYRRVNATLTVHQDFGWRDNEGTRGISDLTTATTVVHGERPVGNGRGFLRVEHVSLDAGRFAGDSDGLHRRAFGGCAFQGATTAGPIATGCPLDTQSSEGTTIALGWAGAHVAADIGTSPLGFGVKNMLGGISVNGKNLGIGWTLTASRRPMTNSLLSYAGARDPLTGLRWGGVTASGVSLNLSHDHGGDHGLWGLLGHHHVNGLRVADNKRMRAMGGYYHRLINRPDEQLRVGINLLHWRYDRNLSGYSLGHGGYYSPQNYVSVGLPVSYSRRGPHWSFQVEGSVSHAWARTDDERVYPVGNVHRTLLERYGPLAWHTLDQIRRGGKSKGIGYRAQAQLERRLGSHWVAGAAITVQRSEDYAPNQALLYLRYNFTPWLGRMPLPVNALDPYGDWR